MSKMMRRYEGVLNGHIGRGKSKIYEKILCNHPTHIGDVYEF